MKLCSSVGLKGQEIVIQRKLEPQRGVWQGLWSRCHTVTDVVLEQGGPRRGQPMDWTLLEASGQHDRMRGPVGIHGPGRSRDASGISGTRATLLLDATDLVTPHAVEMPSSWMYVVSRAFLAGLALPCPLSTRFIRSSSPPQLHTAYLLPSYPHCCL